MESIDDLLSQLKAEYEEKGNPSQPKKQQPVKGEQPPNEPILPIPPTQVQRENNVASSSAEYSLLSDLKAEFEDKKKQQPVKGKQPRKEPILPIIPTKVQRENNVAPSSAEYGLLSNLKAEFEEQDRAEELKRQQQLKEEQLRQEQIKQQQRQAVKKEAEVWLKKLDPKSAEGLWFEEFAYSYPSKLEAAIDYLQALRETKS